LATLATLPTVTKSPRSSGLAAAPGDVTNLDPNGNLRVTADYRSVYSSVLTDWLGGDTSGVMAGGPYTPAVAGPLFR
jgi:uncharacterized protein (DUF1501 family)